MKIYYLALTIILSLNPNLSYSQSTTIESSKSILKQSLGFGEITIEYSRPNVKNRKIFGSLVKYEEVWRTGANYPTFITFKDTTIVEGKTVIPGRYGIYTIPDTDEWIVILSKNTKLWGAFGYNQKDDFLRIKVKPESCEFTETLIFDFENVKGHKAILSLKWETIKIPIHISVEVFNQIIENVNQKSREAKADWSTYNFAANYMLLHKEHLDLAEDWINKSLNMEQNWMNLWTKALLLYENNELKVAIEFGELAINDCEENDEYCSYSTDYQFQVTKWKSQANSSG